MLHKLYEADKGGAGGSTDEGNTENTNETPEAKTWESVLAGLPDEAKTLYQQHTAGLTSALDKERDARKDQEKSLRDLAKKAEAGSEAQKELTDVADKLAVANKRADFFQEAAKPEIGCRNPELAFKVALIDDSFDKRGNVNWLALKESYPELFGEYKKPGADAGTGRTGQVPGLSVDDKLRAALGR